MSESSPIRPSWTVAAADAVQSLVGAIELRRVADAHPSLIRLRHALDSAQNHAERMVLQGLVVDVYFLAEYKLEASVPAAIRRSLRTEVLKHHADGTVSCYLSAIQRLIGNACACSDRPGERARRWIDEHPESRLPVNEIASLFHIHPRTLRRQFAERVGVSIQEYRRQQRSRYAAQLLASSAEKVDTIVSIVGAGSRSTLYRLLSRYGAQASRCKKTSRTFPESRTEITRK